MFHSIMIVIGSMTALWIASYIIREGNKKKKSQNGLCIPCVCGDEKWYCYIHGEQECQYEKCPRCA